MSVALASNALVSLATAAQYLDVEPTVAGDAADNITRAINAASEMIEQRCGRQLMYRASLTEYHTLARYTDTIFLLDSPIIAVTSVHEDETRTYGSTSLLTVLTDYIVLGKQGKLVRVITGGGTTSWACGFRTIKAIYTAGYSLTPGTPALSTAVPFDLEDVALRLAASIYKEANRRQWGLSSQSDAAGNWQRWAPAGFSKQMDEVLANYRRTQFDITGERDA